MRVLLVRPPSPSPLLGGHLPSEPLALETIAAAAPDHEVRILDMQCDPALGRTLESFQPQVVGTGGCTAELPNLLRVLREVKQRDPRVVTVAGGHHATVAPDDLARPEVDAIVLGMGEQSFAELLRAIEARRPIGEVPGLALPAGGRLECTAERPIPADLDGLPPARRDLTARYRRRYRALGHRVAVVNTARGCPFRCRFCSIIVEMRGRYLVRSADRVAAELLTIEEPLVRFADGNTFGSRRRMETLHDAIRGAGVKKRLMVDVRSDTVVKHAELIGRWRAVGLELAAVGLEAINPAQLDRLGKGSGVEDNLRAIEILHHHGVRVIGQFMIDPGFTDDDFDRLLDFALEQRIEIPSFLITTPFPGTPLHEAERARLTTARHELFDCFHATLPTVLPLVDFYRRFVGLYEGAYGDRRLGLALRRRLRGERAPTELPLPVLAGLRLVLAIKRRGVLRALCRDHGLDAT